MRLRQTFLYNPDNAYDMRKIQDMLNGPKYKGVLWDYDQELRRMIKHGDYSDKEYNILEKCREMLWNHLRESSLDLEEI